MRADVKGDWKKKRTGNRICEMYNVRIGVIDLAACDIGTYLSDTRYSYNII